MKKNHNCPRSARIYAFLVSAIVLAACVPPPHAGDIKDMREIVHGDATMTTRNGKAIVIFVRPKDYVYAYTSLIFEVGAEASDPKLIAMLAADTSTIYETDPGKHVFMATGAAAQTNFMTADLLPDSEYFVFVDAELVNWSPYRISLKPPGQNGLSSSVLKARFDKSRVVVKSATAEQWALDNMLDIRSKLDEYNKKVAKGEVPNLGPSTE